MTIETKYDEVLEIIGLDKTRKDMVVLGALLKVQNDPSEFIDFGTLREQLAIDEGSKKGKDPLIYRSLSWLEKEGFVKIDRSGHKHGYNSKISLMEKALSKKLTKTLKTFEKELKQINAEINGLTTMENKIDSIAIRVIDHAAGKMKIEKPVFAQGWNEIRKLLDDKVYKDLKKNDVLRFTLDWFSQIDYMNPSRLNDFEKILKMGVETRSLDRDKSDREVRINFREWFLNWLEKGYIVGYRVSPRKEGTYQFVAKNAEGIVLVVSESPLSATWLPRSANQELVDSAIATFDKDYEAGIDLADYKE